MMNRRFFSLPVSESVAHAATDTKAIRVHTEETPAFPVAMHIM